MRIRKTEYFVAALLVSLSFISNGQELLKNSDWKKQENGTPSNWRFFTYKNKSRIKLLSESFENRKVGVIESDNIKGMGYIGQYATVKLPAGKNIVVSGYYRTENIALGKNGGIGVNINYNYNSKDKEFPRKYQSIRFSPSEKWRKFEAVRALNVPVKNFYSFFILNHAAGKLYFSGLSLKVQESGSRIDPQEKYIWREAEGIRKHVHVSTWGKETKDYYSGSGGIILKNEAFKWDFRIKEEVNPDTLLPEKRNYFVWLRIYGYMERPPVSVFFNKNKISSFNTHPNEQLNAKSEYAGPGKYYWQKAGTFKTVGGNASLNIVPQGRMLLDAVIVTTDSKYAPAQYEARTAADKNFFTDIQTPYAVKSTYRVYGISDKVITPLELRYHGEVTKVPDGQDPAVLHISLPANIKVENISSHWAGKSWNIPDRWGSKYLTWKKTGSESVDGTEYNKYEIYIYYLSLTYTVFAKAESTGFTAGQKLSCKYYLEYKGKKQLAETVPLLTVKLKPARAFKKILIGPAGGNSVSFYQEFPDIAEDMVFAGMNIINAWHLHPERCGDRWKRFRDLCIKNKITIIGEYSPFYGIFGVKDRRFLALDLKGKSSHKPCLVIDEKSAALEKTLQYLLEQGKQGVTGMVLDDEMFNQQGDKYDYNPLTLEKFKEYSAKHGINYIDPKTIIKDKKKYAAQYKLWVDFKCDCMVEIYKKYHQAYSKGVAEASSSTTFGRKFFIAQILKNKTPEESKTNTYWDYRKLASVCDYISPMIYTYGGIKDSAVIGDICEMYNKYIGRKAIAPTLLCEHSGFGDIAMPQKKMYKYQILESLMQQAEIILFWYGPAVYNPVNSQHISEAIRWAEPYEDIILDGKKYNGASCSRPEIRIKGLKLGERVLLYIANYRNPVDKKAQIKLTEKIKSVLEIGTGKKLPVSDNSFTLDFKSDRGKLFLITQ
jgi:hypothetical protein